METNEIIRLLKETPEYKEGGMKKLIGMIEDTEIITYFWYDKSECVGIFVDDSLDYILDDISEEWFEIDEEIRDKVWDWFESLDKGVVWDILKLEEVETWKWSGWDGNDGGCREYGTREEYFGISNVEFCKRIMGEYKIHLRDKKLSGLGL